MKVQIIEKDNHIEQFLIGDGVLIGATEYEIAEIPDDFYENPTNYKVKEIGEVIIPVVIFDENNEDKIIQQCFKGAEIVEIN